MASWSTLEHTVPDLVAAVRERFDAHKHVTVATVRRDGGPRISGTEVVFSGGQLWLGGMTGARRFQDLRRDPRVALHSGSDDPPDWRGDAKLSGRAVEVVDPVEIQELAAGLDEPPPGPFEVFRVDVTELVHLRLGDPADHLVIDTWHEARGRRSVRRS